jgi:hypothetical protein
MQIKLFFVLKVTGCKPFYLICFSIWDETAWKLLWTDAQNSKILKRSGVFSIDRGYLHWNSGACAGKGVLSIMLVRKRFISCACCG